MATKIRRNTPVVAVEVYIPDDKSPTGRSLHGWIVSKAPKGQRIGIVIGFLDGGVQRSGGEFRRPLVWDIFPSSTTVAYVPTNKAGYNMLKKNLPAIVE